MNAAKQGHARRNDATAESDLRLEINASSTPSRKSAPGSQVVGAYPPSFRAPEEHDDEHGAPGRLAITQTVRTDAHSAGTRAGQPGSTLHETFSECVACERSLPARPGHSSTRSVSFRQLNASAYRSARAPPSRGRA